MGIVNSHSKFDTHPTLQNVDRDRSRFGKTIDINSNTNNKNEEDEANEFQKQQKKSHFEFVYAGSAKLQA